MPTPVRRRIVGLALTLPLTLAPASIATAAPASPAAPGGASSRADAASAAAPARSVLRWRQYIAQKPVWSTAACTADVTAALKKIPAKNRPPITCARLATPLDWADLSKGSMTLQVTRLAKAPTRSKAAARGLFVNSGGPGGSAGLMPLGLAKSQPALRTTHDIVGVDPRGTGGSTPLPCTPYPSPVLDERNPSAATRTKIQAAYRAFAEKCVAAHRAVLPYMTTANTVHDQDLARRVLGYPQADWYGVSAGSWMGAYYARLHPTTIGRVIIDANTDFSTDWRSSFHDLPMGFQRRYDQQFLPWAARHDKQFRLGTTARAVRASVERVRSAAGAGRVPGLTPTLLDLAIFTSLYTDEGMPPLAAAIGQTVQQLNTPRRTTAAFRMPAALRSAAAPTPAPAKIPLVTVRQAIICNDGPFTRTPASFEAELRDLSRRYPLIGAEYGMIVAPCAYWKVPTSQKVTLTGVDMPRMLMLQNQLDPATPIEGAKRAHAKVRNTRMVTVAGAGAHGALLGAAPTSCVARTTLAYLQRGVFPSADLTCPGAPLPGDAKTYTYTTG